MTPHGVAWYHAAVANMCSIPTVAHDRGQASMEQIVVYLYAPHLLADVQQALEPPLRGCPVAITDGRRLLDLSWEAAALDLHTGLTLSQARRACPSLQLRPYREQVSRPALTRLWEALVPGSVAVEPDGWQGAFVALPADGPSPEEALPMQALAAAGSRLLTRAREALEVTLVAGIGPNKLIAKAAALLHAREILTAAPPSSDGRPRQPGPPPVRVGLPVHAFMAGLPLKLLWPLPGKLLEQLALLGFRTAGQLAEVGPEALLSRLGRPGWRVWALSRGIDASPVVPLHPPPSVHRVLDLEDPDAPAIEDVVIVHQIRRWAGELARELEQQAQRAGRLVLSLTLRPRGGLVGQTLTLSRSTCPGEDRRHGPAMADLAVRLLQRVLEEAAPWWRAGARPVGLRLAAVELQPAVYRQAAMLTTVQRHLLTQRRLLRAVEAVRRRVGPDGIRTAAEIPLPWREARLALVEQGTWLP